MNAEAKVRVMLVDDSAVIRGFLARFLSESPDIEIVASFNYDFVNIEKDDFRVNPLDIDRRLEESELRFFHTPIQRTQIRNAVSMYDNHPDGVNRFLGRENIKKLYREFEPV